MHRQEAFKQVYIVKSGNSAGYQLKISISINIFRENCNDSKIKVGGKREIINNYCKNTKLNYIAREHSKPVKSGASALIALPRYDRPANENVTPKLGKRTVAYLGSRGNA